MTIKFIVAKNKHQTLEDALKLEPVLRTADVVSREHSAASELEASEEELFFKRINSQSQLKRKLRELFYIALANLASGHEFYGYNCGLDAIILRNQKPVVLIERHPEETARMLQELMSKASSSLDQGHNHLFEGRYKEAIRSVYEWISASDEYSNARDVNIVQNAQSIGKRIFEFYPRLANKPVIRYLVIIGADHNIENGLVSIPNADVEVVHLAPEFAVCHDRIFGKLKSRANFEEYEEHLARYLLAFSYYCILKTQKAETTLAFHLGHLAVQSMGVRDLELMSSKINPNARFAKKIQTLRQFFIERGIEIPKKPIDYQRLLTKYSI